jgi:hypothetical protein
VLFQRALCRYIQRVLADLLPSPTLFQSNIAQCKQHLMFENNSAGILVNMETATKFSNRVKSSIEIDDYKQQEEQAKKVKTAATST